RAHLRGAYRTGIDVEDIDVAVIGKTIKIAVGRSNIHTDQITDHPLASTKAPYTSECGCARCELINGVISRQAVNGRLRGQGDATLCGSRADRMPACDTIGQ